MTQKPILCPRCRTLIGSEEDTCSRCGTSRNSSWWRLVSWSSGALEGEWLVRGLITINLIYYGLSLLVSSSLGRGGGFLSPDRLSLLLLGATGRIPIDSFGRFWSLLSANYLHGGLLHLLFNLMALRQIGPWVVNEYGAGRAFVIYTLGGVFGFGVSYMAGVAFTIGASAAICSLIGSLLYFGKSRGGAYGTSVYREVSGWVISLMIFGLIVPGINNWGHGGGIVGGVLLGMLLGYDDPGRDGLPIRLAAGICGIATLAALAWPLLGLVLR